ncbi:MAG: phosphate acyltransferase PlsX [Hydrogenophilus thermoluteolus]|nr:phosphate acyltransferase PlsX [Rhodocyclaceae bacterium]
MNSALAVDCMGGDRGVSVTIPAIETFLTNNTVARVIAVGMPDRLAPEVERLARRFPDRITLEPASQVVAMDELPQSALRTKRDSSMRRAIELVRDGRAVAAVSAGNTGALMAIARFVLKTLPGIDRPAIATVLPARTGRVWVLDLGANVDCTAEHLLQFGVMGAALVRAVEGVSEPRVGLLNIGEEAIKGNQVVREAAEFLAASPLNFVGNVEDIYAGTADVVVCDGFVGNVALKTTEGLAQMLATFLREEFSRAWWTKLAAMVALPVLRRFKDRVDPRRYNGAVLVGLRGAVVKSHGGVDAYAFGWALERAWEAGTHRLVDRVAEQLAALNGVCAAENTADSTPSAG